MISSTVYPIETMRIPPEHIHHLPISFLRAYLLRADIQLLYIVLCAYRGFFEASKVLKCSPSLQSLVYGIQVLGNKLLCFFAYLFCSVFEKLLECVFFFVFCTLFALQSSPGMCSIHKRLSVCAAENPSTKT